LELERFVGRLDKVLPTSNDDVCATMGEPGSDILIGVRGILRLHDDGMRAASNGGMNKND
jgi:hypothetical protein